MTAHIRLVRAKFGSNNHVVHCHQSDTYLLLIMDSIKARAKNIDGDGDDVDDDIPNEPRPTRREILNAVSTIGKCIEDSNDPLAPKLDTLVEDVQ